MPDYSRIHEMVSHRVCIEYDTGARIVGYLASCQPGSGPVQFVKLTSAELQDASGRTVLKAGDITICPNIVTAFRMEEGPRGRDLK
jgi:hypothetical protein